MLVSSGRLHDFLKKYWGVLIYKEGGTCDHQPWFFIDCQKCYRWKRKQHEKYKRKLSSWERTERKIGKGKTFDGFIIINMSGWPKVRIVTAPRNKIELMISSVLIYM